MAEHNTYAANGLTGGTAGFLDDIVSDILRDGDVCIVTDAANNKFYVFNWDEDSGLAEDTGTHPYVVKPDDDPTTGRWIEAKIIYPIAPTEIADDDDDTKIQVEESADEDKIRFDTGGTQRAMIDSSGLVLQSGADVNEFSTDGTFAGNSDDAVPTEKATKAYVDTNTLSIGGVTVANIWHSGNDGSGSGLDADKLDAKEASAFGQLATAAEWTKQQNFNESSITSSSNSVAWDLDSAQCAVHTLTENTTIAAPSNMNAGGTYVLRVVQASGVFTLSWNAVFDWGEESAPAAPAANGDVCVFTFYSDGTNMYGVEMVRVEA